MHNTEEAKEKILTFLQDIGIRLIYQPITEKTFLPGLQIKGPSIIIDKEKWLYVGDIVHEAGHIAVVPPTDRESLEETTIGNRKDQAAEEMMAIAWSYAVCVHLQIDPYIVFHEYGYKGGGQSIADNFKEGRTFGVPMLQYTHMCIDGNSPLYQVGNSCYPMMIKWMRED